MKFVTFTFFSVFAIFELKFGNTNYQDHFSSPSAFKFFKLKNFKSVENIFKPKSWNGNKNWNKNYKAQHDLIGWKSKGHYHDDWKNDRNKWDEKVFKLHQVNKNFGWKGWNDFKNGKKNAKHKYWESKGKSDRWKNWDNKWNYKKNKGSSYIKSFLWDRESGKNHSSKSGNWKDGKHGNKKNYWELHGSKKRIYKKYNNHHKNGWWNRGDHQDRWSDWIKSGEGKNY